MSDDTVVQKVQEAKAPSWKKVLIWMAAVLALIVGVVVLLVMLFRKKGPVAATIDVVNYAKQQAAKADVDAMIAMARAESAEESVVKRLVEIREIQDAEERAKRLAELF
jgi:hypothetical protein